MKILIFILLLYVGYRFVLLPALRPGNQEESRNDDSKNHKDDYIDYEEVD